MNLRDGKPPHVTTQGLERSAKKNTVADLSEPWGEQQDA
jgi:hypothetical protein